MPANQINRGLSQLAFGNLLIRFIALSVLINVFTFLDAYRNRQPLRNEHEQ